MQIQINSDKNIVLHTRLSNFVDTEINRILSRFNTHLTRVEAHLSDENAAKSGPQDKRCLLEARPRDHQAVAVTESAADIQAAVSVAAHKMQRLLESTFGRIEAKRPMPSTIPATE